MGTLSRAFEEGDPVLGVDQVIAIEQACVAAGHLLLELMEQAGAATAEVAQELLGPVGPATEAPKVVILAGPGNNGGDGWVAADRLAACGYGVALITREPADAITAEPARTAALKADASGRFAIEVLPDDEQLHGLLSDADLVIDGILGTGFSHSSVREPIACWIRLANEARINWGTSILAVDCPSGLDARTGSSANPCIAADATITMIAAKAGLLEPAAKPLVGTLRVAPLLPYCEQLVRNPA